MGDSYLRFDSHIESTNCIFISNEHQTNKKINLHGKNKVESQRLETTGNKKQQL